ncbi:helix-turn-helix domain-containing protein [Streptomyces sp. URMC 123]|uniref:helix-turn-helix domain-containing protein n=1 Tax=Streptomyces sp. URMC 123 TaxID=3423403 RepID=UPI003F1CF777
MHRLDVPAPHILPFAIGSFDSIGPLSRASFPHRHTFYEIVHVTGGRGHHVVDLSRWPLHPPHLCVIVPGQVHYWEAVTELRGRVVLFDDAFLLPHPGDRALLRRLGEHPWFRLDARDSADIAPVVAELAREYRARRPGMVSVLQAYLHILIVRAGRLLDRSPDLPAAPAAARPRYDGAAALAERFALLLARPEDLAGCSVGSCAARLGVSVGYLTEAVKLATGRTPGQLIRHCQALEAKRLLASTDLTVSRVAREVGFADPAYFCRFFRRETGATPGQFRRAARGNHQTDRDLSIAPSAPPS